MAQIGKEAEHSSTSNPPPATLDPVVARVEILRIIVECHVQLQLGQWRLRDSIAKVRGRLRSVDDRIKKLTSYPDAQGVQTVKREYEELSRLVREEHMEALGRLRQGQQLLDAVANRLASLGDDADRYKLLQSLERQLATWLRSEK